MPGPEDPAPGGGPVLRWAAGFAPEYSDVWARSELAVEAAPPAVFCRLITASRWEQDFSGIRRVRVPASGRGCLAPDSEFEFELDRQRLCARVSEFVPGSRLAWSGLGIDISTYHEWVISGGPGRSRILAGFAARGAAAVALRETDPGAAQAMLGRWLADLRAVAESARRLRAVSRGESVPEGSTGRDAQLGEDLVEVAAYCPGGQEEPFRDLLVGQA